MTIPRPLAVAFGILLLLASLHPAHAQTPWYRVEVVVFAELDEDARFAETWRADPGLPDTSGAVAAGVGGRGVRPVGPSGYRLSGVWQAMLRSGAYRPLRHVAWNQPGLSSGRAPEVSLGEPGTSSVAGTVQLSRSRFLHLRVDLLYEGDDGRYRLQTRRKVRSNVLNYIDHPRFGVVAIVTALDG